jgi:hypothetical protein
MLLCCANLPLAKPGGRPGESALRLFGAEMGNAPLRSLRREALRFPALQPPLFSLLFFGPQIPMYLQASAQGLVPFRAQPGMAGHLLRGSLNNQTKQTPNQKQETENCLK